MTGGVTNAPQKPTKCNLVSINVPTTLLKKAFVRSQPSMQGKTSLAG